MSSSFEKLKQNLEDSLDRVLDKQYSPNDVSEHVKDMIGGGDGKDNFAKYMVFQVKLEEKGGETYSQTYLRGFEEKIDRHTMIANFFLNELRGLVNNYFDLPEMWPPVNNVKKTRDKSFTRERDGLTLTVEALGGGRYNFSDKTINTWGVSTDFDLLPPNKILPELLQELIQKRPYQGFNQFSIKPI